MPGSPVPGSNRGVGSISMRPEGVISNHAASPSAPNRFFPHESRRRPDRRVPLERQDHVNRVLEGLGPCQVAVLRHVTGHDDRDALGLREPRERSAHDRTCDDPPGT